MSDSSSPLPRNFSSRLVPVVERSTLAVLCEQLRVRIRDGRLVAGARLVEAELAFELDTSRAPLREAIMILAGERLVDLVPHKGARVRQLGAAELAERIALRTSLAGTLALLAARARAGSSRPPGVDDPGGAALLAAQATIDMRSETGEQEPCLAMFECEERYFDALSGIAGDTQVRRMLDESLLPLERTMAGGAPDTARFKHLSQMLTRAVLEGRADLSEQIAREWAHANT